MNKSENSRGTLAENVENRLMEYLRQHQLKFGELLPKETELAEQLQISRHIVREGISRLKALGIVESKKHCGTILCRPEPFTGLQKLADAQLFTEQDRQNFMELRIAMELGMCDFIFARRSAEKIRKLRKAAGSKKTSVRQIDDEVDFHSCLMAFAENPAANDFRKVLMLAFGSVRASTGQNRTTPSHIEICDILEDGTAADFHAVMRLHFLPYFEKKDNFLRRFSDERKTEK